MTSEFGIFLFGKISINGSAWTVSEGHSTAQTEHP